MPIIRTFESLLTDEDFASAGLKVEHHPKRNASFIYPASRLIADDGENCLLHPSSISTRHFRPESFIYTDSCLNRWENSDLSAVIERLKELQEVAAEEEIEFHEASAQEAIEWLRSIAPRELPSAFLVNNGNVRLLWREDGKQLGVQFLGNGLAQFVFLGENDQTDRVLGTRSVHDLGKLIAALDVRDIVGF